VLSTGYDDVEFVQIISGNSCMVIRSVLKQLTDEKKDDFIKLIPLKKLSFNWFFN
jgi:hypothetical protein